MDPGSVGEYTTERGDVLLSVQLVLIRENERQAGAMATVRATGSASALRVLEAPSPLGERTVPVEAAPPAASPVAAIVEPPTLQPVVEPLAASVVPPPEAAPMSEAVRPPLTSVPRDPPPVQVAGPPTWMGMSDTGIGVAGVSALRRDLVLEQAWPTARAPRPVVLLVTVQSPGERWLAPAEADHLTRAMWALVAEHLGPKDRLYRTGPCELSAVLRGLDGRSPEEVETAIERPLSATIEARVRGSRLRMAMIEPAEAVRRLAAVHWTDGDSAPQPLTAGGLASAV